MSRIIPHAWIGPALACAALAGAAQAQPPAAEPQPRTAAAVDVQLGPAVQARADELGRDALEAEAAYLRRDVDAALAHAGRPPRSVRLVIADIEPNRPTSAELGASAQLRQSSFGLGGAAVTGTVVGADGAALPIRYRFFPTELATEANFTTWGDADQAFDDLAAAIGAGQAPDDPHAWPPPHRRRALTGTRVW